MIFCWFVFPEPNVPTPMKNARFCQITLFCSSGFEKAMQFVVPVGQVMWLAGETKVAVSSKEVGCWLRLRIAGTMRCSRP